jgi:formylglycine-generating enzyme required for sulfatase activity
MSRPINNRRLIGALCSTAALAIGLTTGSPLATTPPAEMILITGGTFDMGDVFEEGDTDEGPVHQVRVSDLYLSTNEVTVVEFKAFVEATQYLTSAERFDSREAQQRRIDQLEEMDLADPEVRKKAGELMQQVIASGGCFYWKPDQPGFDFSLDCNWRQPLFEQTDRDPVVCLSWEDAAAYCNWLSDKEDLAPSYDVETGQLLDANGAATTDVTQVVGYRLPTEAEWEFAARERGARVRFGNGMNVARATELNFEACRGEYPYSEQGDCRKRTVPVGSFAPNALGLHDMSGNAWEWCSDYYAPYGADTVVDPHVSVGRGRVIRGGRWGGDAREARACTRIAYEAHNRCNNSGFRVARSK